MKVDLCVCANVTFREILSLHQQGVPPEVIKERTGCGQNCTICQPYIERTLETGEVEHPVLPLKPKSDGLRSA